MDKKLGNTPQLEYLLSTGEGSQTLHEKLIEEGSLQGKRSS